MKRTALFSLAAALLLLVGVVTSRAGRFSSRQPPLAPASAPAPDPRAAAERLAEAIRFETVSHQDRSRVDSAAFLGLRDYLASTYPGVHAALEPEVVGGASLLYTWRGSEATLAPLLLMGHLDVVPVAPGTERQWTHPPFAGAIVDGHVWGRGALDDKGAVIALLEAAEGLLSDGFQPRRTVLFAFGHDEEVGGNEGAARIAEIVTSRHGELAMVLDEGSAIIDRLDGSGGRPVALVGVAEKGYLSLELVVEAEGGHSSMPPPATAAGILARAVARIEESPFPARLDGATRGMLEYLGAEMPFPRRLLIANLWLFEPLVRRGMLSRPATAAMVRTTTAPTMLAAGVKENVLPATARAVVNFRILPGDTVASVTGRVKKIVDHPRVAITALSTPSEPSPISDPDAPAFRFLGRALRRADPDPDLLIAPFLVVAGTDAKHYSGRSPNVYRFLPVLLSQEDLARFHGVDERLSLDDLSRSIAFYRELMTGADGASL